MKKTKLISKIFLFFGGIFLPIFGILAAPKIEINKKLNPSNLEIAASEKIEISVTQSEFSSSRAGFFYFRPPNFLQNLQVLENPKCFFTKRKI